MRHTTAPNRPSSDPIRVVDDSLVAMLQCQRQYPSVSVLLTTTPGPMLASGDVVRLHHLLRVADQRLRQAAPADQADLISQRLQQLAIAVRRAPASRALGLFASATYAAAVELPVPVEDRVVVDATFATRDLVRARRAVDRFRLLVLDLRGFRLLEGHAGRLVEVDIDAFQVADAPHRGDRSAMFGRDRSDVRDAVLHARIRAADEALARRRTAEPLPLVIAGVERHVAMFRARSAEAASMVGEIVGSHRRTTAHRLGRLAAPVIEEHHRRRSAMALARLDAGVGRDRVVTGIDAVWAAAAAGRVGLLCVEENLKVPGFVHPALRPSPPVDDVVDELIELVTMADGEVVMLEDGRLSDCDCVAALVSC